MDQAGEGDESGKVGGLNLWHACQRGPLLLQVVHSKSCSQLDLAGDGSLKWEKRCKSFPQVTAEQLQCRYPILPIGIDAPR